MAPKKKASLEYNGIRSNGRRKAPAVKTIHEDEMLKPRDRSKLTGTINDQARNLSLVAWMIRKHLDYVTDFTPFIRTGSKELDKKLYSLFKWHGRKENFDIAKRHSRKRFLRLYETHKLKDGDALAVMLETGNMQGIETDRVKADNSVQRNGKSFPKGVKENGLVLDKYGAIKQICICNRVDKQLVYSHAENAENCIFDGYFSRFDQSRGVSPLTTAITAVQDLYEGWDFTLLKIKLHALFGIAISQKLDEEDTGLNDEGVVDNSDIGSDIITEAGTEGTADAATDELSFSDGPTLVRLEPGEEAKTIESQTPSSGFLDFSEIMVRIVLLALDIPYTFFNSMKSSFSARIIDRTEYEESCRQKREDNKAFLNQYAAWKLASWSKIPEVKKLMQGANVSLLDLYSMVEWIPRGQPWYDPSAQIEAELKAVAGGIQSRQRIARKYNDGEESDWWKIIEELEEEEREIKSRKVTVQIGQPGAATLNDTAENGENNAGSDSTTE